MHLSGLRTEGKWKVVKGERFCRVVVDLKREGAIAWARVWLNSRGRKEVSFSSLNLEARKILMKTTEPGCLMRNSF